MRRGNARLVEDAVAQLRVEQPVDRHVELWEGAVPDRDGDESMTIALRGLVESEQHEVRTRLDRALSGCRLPDGRECAHLEVIGHRESREAELATQQVGRDAP